MKKKKAKWGEPSPIEIAGITVGSVILDTTPQSEEEKANDFTLNFRVEKRKLSRKNTILLAQAFGYLPTTKLTYKTSRKYQRPKHHRKH